MRSSPQSVSFGRRAFPGVKPWTRDAELVFLVGAPRSGTTWLQALLASHPEIHSGPETHFFSTYHAVDMEFWRTKDRRLGLSEYLGRDAFYDMIGETFRRVISALPEPNQPPRYFLEKSPHHCLAAEFILSTFPNARFIHLVRDPRSVVASLLRVSKDWGESWAPKTVDEASRMWVERVESSRRCAELVASAEHFAEVRYEDLRAEPGKQLGSLLGFLGLAADDAWLESTVAANSLDRARTEGRPFESIAMPGGSGHGVEAYPEGFIGAAPADGRDAALSDEAVEGIEAIAGPLMRECGYEALGAAPEAADRITASVVVVTEGDDPEPALRTLCAIAPHWRDDWELLLVAHGGCAAQDAARHLQGDVRVLNCSREISLPALLQHAGKRARGGRLMLSEADSMLSLDREKLNTLADSCGGGETLQWLKRQGVAAPIQL